jgi:hypothetical protein
MRRSTYDQLPTELQASVDTLIKSSRFQGFDELVVKVNELLASSGVELSFSRTALYNHSKNLKEILDQIKYSQEAARHMMEAYPDEDLSLSQATTRMVQDRLFRLTMDVDQELDPSELGKIAKALSDMAKSNVAERKYLDDRTEKLKKETKNIQGQVSEGKISFEEAFTKITQEVYGV